jgi:hypothetical protein
MRIQLKEKQVKLSEILQLNPTVDNPLDELTYSHWIHRVTNIQYLLGRSPNGINGC